MHIALEPEVLERWLSRREKRTVTLFFLSNTEFCNTFWHAHAHTHARSNEAEVNGEQYNYKVVRTREKLERRTRKYIVEVYIRDRGE